MTTAFSRPAFQSRVVPVIVITEVAQAVPMPQQHAAAHPKRLPQPLQHVGLMAA